MSVLAARERRKADEMLSRGYEPWKRKVQAGVRGQLSRRNIHFDDLDLDGFYNQAWHGLHTKLIEGENISNPEGFLVRAMFCRAIEEFRLRHVDRYEKDGIDALEYGTEVDLPSRLDDQRTLRHFQEGLADRLDERERRAATLCYIHGYTRPEAARLMGVEPKRLEKIMDGDGDKKPGAAKKVAALIKDIEAGLWCEKRQSLMKAYAFGLLDLEGKRYAEARVHLADCTACQRYVKSLRGLGAVLPPVALPVGAAGSPAAADTLGTLHGVLESARDTVIGLAGGGHAAEAALAAGGVAGAGAAGKAGSAGAGAGTVAAAATATAGSAAAGGAAATGAGGLISGVGSFLGGKIAVGCAIVIAGGGACVAVTDTVLKSDKPPAKKAKAPDRKARGLTTRPAAANEPATFGLTGPLGAMSAGGASSGTAAGSSASSSPRATSASTGSASKKSSRTEFGFERGGSSSTTSVKRAPAPARAPSAPSAAREFGIEQSRPAPATRSAPDPTPQPSTAPKPSTAPNPPSADKAPSAASEFGFEGD